MTGNLRDKYIPFQVQIIWTSSCPLNGRFYATDIFKSRLRRLSRSILYKDKK